MMKGYHNMGKKDGSINDKLANHMLDFTNNRLDIASSRGKVTKSIDTHFSTVKHPKPIKPDTDATVAALVTDITQEYTAYTNPDLPPEHAPVKALYSHLKSPKDRGKVISRLERICERAADKKHRAVGNLPIEKIKEAQETFFDGIK